MGKKKLKKRSAVLIGNEQTLYDSQQQAPRKRGRPRKFLHVEEKVNDQDYGSCEDEDVEKKKFKAGKNEEEEEEEEGKDEASEERRPGSSKRRTIRKSRRPQKSI